MIRKEKKTEQNLESNATDAILTNYYQDSSLVEVKRCRNFPELNEDKRLSNKCQRFTTTSEGKGLSVPLTWEVSIVILILSCNDNKILRNCLKKSLHVT